MQQRRTRNQFWYLFGPILIKWGIDFLVEGVAGFIYLIANAARLNLDSGQSAMVDQAVILSRELSQYATEITTAAAVCIIPVMWYFFYKDRKQEKMTGSFLRQKISIPVYGAIIVMGISACLALNNLLILSSVSSVSQNYQAAAKNIYQSPFLMQLVGLGIVVPVAEELVYRGLLYKRMRENMPVRSSIIFSAVIFGVIHGNLVQFIYAGLLGVLLAYTYEKTTSLKAPILLHVAVNLTSVVATRVSLFDWMFQDIMRLGVSTALTAAVAAGMFVIVRGEN